MAKLVLIRHGQSEWNALNLFNGWIDTKLSKKGIAQAKEAGDLLAAEGIQFDQAYTSVLTRAIQTLHCTSTKHACARVPCGSTPRCACL